MVLSSRQESWSGLSFPSPGDLPDPGIELTSLVPPALAGGFFTTVPRETHQIHQSAEFGIEGEGEEALSFICSVPVSKRRLYVLFRELEIYTEKAMATHSILLPGKSHGWRSLVGCSPQGR